MEYIPGTEIPKPAVSDFGRDGNAFSLMAQVSAALKRVKAPNEIINQFRQLAMSGDYDNLLVTCGRYVDISVSLTRSMEHESEYDTECDDCGYGPCECLERHQDD